MWGARGEGSAGEIGCMGRKMLLTGRSMPYASILRFLLFIVDGKFAISAGHTRHELAPGPRELLSSLRNPFVSLSSERHPSFPILPFLFRLSFSSRLCH